MGWWETNEEGVSFAHSRDGMVWGDGPADEVDGALHAIRQQYIAEWGRLPSRTEIIAGLSFSLRVFLEHLPERPESSPLTEEEQQDYASALYKLRDPAISDLTRVRLQKIVADTEARFASEDDEPDEEESDADFAERFPKLLSLMNDKVGLVFSVPGPEVGSEAESDVQTPSGEDLATVQFRKDLKADPPRLSIVEKTPGVFGKLEQWFNRPVAARYVGYRQREVELRGLLRYRPGEKTCADFTEEPYLVVEEFSGKSASGSSTMEISPLTLDELTPQELRDWNLSEPVEFTRFVFEDHFTKGW
jgi:hypothetical protein